MSLMRKIAAGIMAQLRILALTPLSLVTSYLTPLALAAVVISLSGGPTPALIVGTATAAVLNTLILQSFFIVFQERAWGTMELLSAAPAGLAVVLAGRLIGVLAQAMLAVPLALGLGLAAGGTAAPGSWVIVFASSAVILLGLVGIALLHMSLAIRYRTYTAFINGLFPLSIVFMGLFVPTSRLPYSIDIIGHVFAPTWGMDAIRETSWRPLIAGALIAGLTITVATWCVSYLGRWMRNSPSAYHN